MSFQLSATPRSPTSPASANAPTDRLTMKAAPTAMNTTPSARVKRVVVPSFSIAITAPSTAIQTTFITPTANISSIIAQQQPRQ